jgi:hypothetical protein
MEYGGELRKLKAFGLVLIPTKDLAHSAPSSHRQQMMREGSYNS